MIYELPVLPSSPPCPLLHRTSQRSAYRQLLWEQSPTCFYCGATIRRRGGTLDHVLPQSRGGGHHPSNLVLCCRHCNLAKRDRTLPEWQADLSRALEQVPGDLLSLAAG